MKKNTSIIATTVLILICMVGAFIWTRSPSQVATEREQVAVGTEQPSAKPTPNMRALGLSSAANGDIAQGNYEQGIEKYRQSLSIQKDPDTQIHLAVALLQLKRKDEAVQILRDVAQRQDRAGNAAQKILSKLERSPN